jgi:hypothetical protein
LINQLKIVSNNIPQSLIGKFDNSSYLKYFDKEFTIDLEVILAKSPLVPLITEYLRVYFEYPEIENEYKKTVATVQAYNNTMATEVIDLEAIKEDKSNPVNIFEQLMNNKTTTNPELGWTINCLRNKKNDNYFGKFYISEYEQKTFLEFLQSTIEEPRSVIKIADNLIDNNKDWTKQEMMRGNYLAVRFKTDLHRLILFRYILAAVQQSIR